MALKRFNHFSLLRLSHKIFYMKQIVIAYDILYRKIYVQKFTISSRLQENGANVEAAL